MADNTTRKRGRTRTSERQREQQLRQVVRQEKACKDLSFQDCELAILRMAVDKAEEKMARRAVNSEDIQRVIKVVEDFIKRKRLVCYGGTAINNILPEEDQFYNKELEIPDYDFFSPTALEDAKELADIYYGLGYSDVEAKSGQHHGTYKIFVHFIPIADISLLPKPIFQALRKDAIEVDGILYAPPNFLRMSMYLELSRPAGDTTRWEKVLKRLTILNKHFPITDVNCDEVEFQRRMDVTNKEEEEVYDAVRDTLVRQGCVFFGGYAISLYAQYMPAHLRHKLEKVADFDVLSNDAEATANIVAKRLREMGLQKVTVTRLDAIGEIVPLHFEIKVGHDSVAFVYQPVACHSYNVLRLKGQKVRIATIDTMLSFYLAFLFADKPYYNDFLDRILCMSKFLFDVQQQNRLQQKGLLRRFSITCYGHQETKEEMKAHKAEVFKRLKDAGKNKSDREFEEWFLSYVPDQLNQRKNQKKAVATTRKHKKRSAKSQSWIATFLATKKKKTRVKA